MYGTLELTAISTFNCAAYMHAAAKVAGIKNEHARRVVDLSTINSDITALTARLISGGVEADDAAGEKQHLIDLIEIAAQHTKEIARLRLINNIPYTPLEQAQTVCIIIKDRECIVTQSGIKYAWFAAGAAPANEKRELREPAGESKTAEIVIKHEQPGAAWSDVAVFFISENNTRITPEYAWKLGINVHTITTDVFKYAGFVRWRNRVFEVYADIGEDVDLIEHLHNGTMEGRAIPPESIVSIAPQTPVDESDWIIMAADDTAIYIEHSGAEHQIYMLVPDTWKCFTMPRPIFGDHHYLFVVGGALYAFGRENVAERLQFSAWQWEILAPFPPENKDVADTAIVYKREIWFINNITCIYNPATNEWRIGKSVPGAILNSGGRAGVLLAVWNSAIFRCR